jgi:hypothetical protein
MLGSKVHSSARSPFASNNVPPQVHCLDAADAHTVSLNFNWLEPQGGCFGNHWHYPIARLAHQPFLSAPQVKRYLEHTSGAHNHPAGPTDEPDHPLLPGTVSRTTITAKRLAAQAPAVRTVQITLTRSTYLDPTNADSVTDAVGLRRARRSSIIATGADAAVVALFVPGPPRRCRTLRARACW